jgi:hypothetical protein
MKENLKRFWVWIWGDSTPSTEPPGASSAYAIGFGVGLNGGSVADAARLQYVLSRIVPPGQQPTSNQIATAVGMLNGGVAEAVVIHTLLRSNTKTTL